MTFGFHGDVAGPSLGVDPVMQLPIDTQLADLGFVSSELRLESTKLATWLLMYANHKHG